jgi:DNA-binding beta-propeller fold protein YncE
VHQALPLTVLTGYFLGELLDRFKKGIFRALFIGVSSVLTLFVFRSNIMLLQHPDDAREVIVYVQSNGNIRNIVREVDRIAFEGGMAGNLDRIRRTDVKPLTIGMAEGAWPLSWYFRHYITSTMISKNYPVNIGKPTTMTDDKLALGGQFEATVYGFREHWSTDVDTSRPGKRFSKEWWRSHLRYFFYRYPWSATGAERLVFYRKHQIRELLPAAEEYIRGFDQPASYVQPIKSWGGPGTGNGQFRTPRGIAVGPDGSVYVVDSLNFRVQKFSPDGEFLLQFGGRSPKAGEGDGLFAENYGMGPCGIAVDRNGVVYVTDTWGGRIQKFDSEGRYIESIRPGPNEGFYGPRDIAIGADGRIYLSDTGNRKIKVFEPNGRYGTSIGTAGAGRAEFNEQVGICITPGDTILVADVGNQRVQELDSKGAFVRKLQIWGWQAGIADIPHVEPYIARAEDGTLFVTDSTRRAVYQIAPDWQSVRVWGNQSNFRKPTGIAVSPDGFVYVVDSDGNRVSKFKRE